MEPEVELIGKFSEEVIDFAKKRLTPKLTTPELRKAPVGHLHRYYFHRFSLPEITGKILFKPVRLGVVREPAQVSFKQLMQMTEGEFEDLQKREPVFVVKAKLMDDLKMDPSNYGIVDFLQQDKDIRIPQGYWVPGEQKGWTWNEEYMECGGMVQKYCKKRQLGKAYYPLKHDGSVANEAFVTGVAAMKRLPAWIVPTAHSNLLSLLKQEIGGVKGYQAFITAIGTMTAGHVENQNLGYVNLCCSGASEWICAAAKHSEKIMYLAHNRCSGKEKRNHRHSVTCYPLKEDLLNRGIDVIMFNQEPGDIVIVSPGTFHAVKGLEDSVHLAANFCPRSELQLEAIMQYECDYESSPRNNIVETKYMFLEAIRSKFGLLSCECYNSIANGLWQVLQQKINDDIIVCRNKLPKAEATLVQTWERISHSKFTKFCYDCHVEIFTPIVIAWVEAETEDEKNQNHQDENQEGFCLKSFCTLCAVKNHSEEKLFVHNNALSREEIYDCLKTSLELRDSLATKYVDADPTNGNTGKPTTGPSITQVKRKATKNDVDPAKTRRVIDHPRAKEECLLESEVEKHIKDPGHTAEKLWECLICTRTFLQRAKCRRHLESRHVIQQKNKCQYCQKLFKGRSGIRMHETYCRNSVNTPKKPTQEKSTDGAHSASVLEVPATESVENVVPHVSRTRSGKRRE